MPTPHRPPLAVVRTLRKLGHDLKEARIKRRLPAEVVANRAFTSRPTLQRVEAGDPGVGMGIYASVMHALGLLEHLASVADPAKDTVGLALTSESLPKAARPKRREP